MFEVQSENNAGRTFTRKEISIKRVVSNTPTSFDSPYIFSEATLCFQ